MAALRDRKMGNFLNFVYDGVDVTEQSIRGYTEGYLGLCDFKVFDINQIPDDGEKYYYFFEHRYYLATKSISDGKLPISDEILNLLKTNPNFNIIFSNDAESDDDFLIEYLDKTFKDLSVDTSKIVVINCNERNTDLKIRLNTLMKTHTTNNGKFAYSKELSRFPYQYNEKRNFLFMCYNRSVKSHRFGLLGHLMRHNIIDTIDWSWIRGYEIMKHYLKSEHDLMNSWFLNEIFSKKEIIEYKSEIMDLAEVQIKKSVNESNYEVDGEGHCFDTQASYSNNPYSNSYINIVTETNFYKNDIVILSEKSFIPLYFSQIPIIMSSVNHIQKMRDRHGFDFFDDIVNHSYDREPDFKKRFKMIVDEIIRLNGKKEEIEIFVKKNKNRFDRNVRIVEDLIKDKTDYDFYNSLR